MTVLAPGIGGSVGNATRGHWASARCAPGRAGERQQSHGRGLNNVDGEEMETIEDGVGE
jgi:hypothetical protein